MSRTQLEESFIRERKTEVNIIPTFVTIMETSLNTKNVHKKEINAKTKKERIIPNQNTNKNKYFLVVGRWNT